MMNTIKRFNQTNIFWLILEICTRFPTKIWDYVHKSGYKEKSNIHAAILGENYIKCVHYYIAANLVAAMLWHYKQYTS